MMRIASFNLENLDAARNADMPLDARIPVLRPQLERLAADVLCLQELNAVRPAGQEERRLEALDTLLRGTDYAQFHRATSVHPATGGPAERHNLVILSRWPIAAQAQYWHDLVAAPAYRLATAEPEHGPEEVRWDRPVLYAAIALPGGRRLHAINVHLRAPLASPVPGQKVGSAAWKSVSGWAEGFFVAALKRSGQALEVRRLVDRLFDAEPEAFIVVAGDFNCEEQETPLRIVRGDIEDTGTGELAKRSLVPLDRTLSQSQRFSIIHGGQRLMFDHMLISRPLLARYRRFEAHNETLSDELMSPAGGPSPESNHAPIVAEFDLAEFDPD